MLNGMTNSRQFMSLYIRLGIGLFIILLFLITGCAHKKDDTVLPLEWSGEPTLHQVRSATLREKMRSLKVLMFDNIYDELQFDEERARQAASIAETAKAMAEVALNISDVKQELNLNADHALVFRNYAHQLKNQALALQQAARLEKSDTYPSMISDIVKTCNGCHSKFRRM
jgi:cytochrome c556